MADPIANSSRTRAKVRLALRAERAFGLGAVRARLVNSQAAGLPAPAIVTSVTKDAPTPLSASSRSAGSSPPQPSLLTPSLLEPFTAPLLSTNDKRIRLKAMDENEVRDCVRCRLCKTRTKSVFGEGDVDASIFFIGEGPGENEDLSGRPFVGKAGQLLDKMIVAMGLRRDQVFIANIVKCRPPGNRVPAPDEVDTCTPYLERQLEIIRPRAIVTLGLPAAKYMLQSNSTMGKLRGQWHSWRGIKLMPTFHPAYILRSYTPATRAAVWSDLQLVMNEVGLAPARRAQHEEK